MKNFSLHLQTRIEFGQGTIARTGEEAAKLGKRVLLLYGKGSIHRNGVYDAIVKSFQENQIEWVEHGGVSPNPRLFHTWEGAKLAQEFNADLIVAAGGGSVADEAKGIAAGFYTGGADELWDFFTRKASVKQALPIISVMTMPATSSEMNEASVITHDETKEKFSVRTSLLAPKVAVLDPNVTVDIPMKQTAFACTDIISHLSEGFFTHTDPFAPVQEGFSLTMITAVRQAMDRLMKNPKDLDARSAVMWAASLGWNGLGAAGWEGARIPCHTLEHPVSGLYDVAHGAGLSIVTPAYLKLRKAQITDRLRTFGKQIFGMEGSFSSDDVIGVLESWYQTIGTPIRLGEAVDSYDISLLTEEAVKLNGIWNASGLSDEEIEQTYRLME